MNSFLYVNYTDRLHKKIARKMIANIVKAYSECLGTKLDYVGMGSLYFADFIELHNTGAIAGMKSIECMTDAEGNFEDAKYKRFMNNRPYDSIEIIPKMSNEAIEGMQFDNNTVVWFDYEASINEMTIEDTANVIRKMKKSGLLISVTNAYIPYIYKLYDKQLDRELLDETLGKYVTPETRELYDGIVWENYSDNVHDMVDPYYRKLVKDKNESEGRNFELIKLSRISYRDSSEYLIEIWALADMDEVSMDTIENRLLTLPEMGEHRIDMVLLTDKEKEFVSRLSMEDVDSASEILGVDAQSLTQYLKYREYHNLW